MYVCMYACMYVCMYVFMYVSMYVCMYVYICICICIYIYIQTALDFRLFLVRPSGVLESPGSDRPMATRESGFSMIHEGYFKGTRSVAISG